MAVREDVKDIEHQLNTVNEEGLTIGLKRKKQIYEKF